MGDLSPEYVGCTWKRGPQGAVVGARFRGRNASGKKIVVDGLDDHGRASPVGCSRGT